ncbi:CAF17-like 4Fe-4S cluster assembly/insertion protein YgfZ [Methylovorus glucosotrophus]|uniref:Folate-binding protein YgfZ n=1 Tax=Methylovorus glucosotrophus (strain SIP3-4) TaxID=582744 RepID=C6XC36_METGS|nr:folate-binding protein YgfZ [Methylovorus glucosotrophus]ACT50111.1 folate-binding protein YgfZ [Methylovorus glucosotrophus SIP3-4]
MTQWQEFLQSRGASIVDGRLLDFGAPAKELAAARHDHVMADLSHLGLLQVDGEDTITFLQGQLTNDINLLNGSNSHYAGYCTAKGRLLALFLAFAHQGHIHLQLNGRLLEPILKRLKMYVLRSKVVIQDVSTTIVRIGVAGSNSEAILGAMFEFVPTEVHGISTQENATLIRLPGALPRFEIFTAQENAQELWQELEQHFDPVGQTGWDWLEIEAGIPEIFPATQEAFVPQMVNLDALGGINFKKGCYTGQEIVARTHYLGKVKRRSLIGSLTATDSLPQPGDEVFAGEGEAVGQVVRSSGIAGVESRVLIELRQEASLGKTVTWQGLPIDLQPMPYPFPPDRT